MNAENQPSRAAAPIIAAQMFPIDVLGDLKVLFRASRNCGYRAVLTFGDGSPAAALQSQGR